MAIVTVVFKFGYVSVGRQDYEMPLLQMRSPLLSRSTVKVIFYKVKDILHCHSMFNIELAEHIRMWDEMEQLGNVFTASVRFYITSTLLTELLMKYALNLFISPS